MDDAHRVTFRVYGVPAPQGSMRAFVRPGMKRAILTSDNTQVKPWRALVSAAAAGVCPALAFPRGVPVAIEGTFYVPRPASAPRRVTHPTKKPDLDKLLRALGDALTGIVWQDDSQVVRIAMQKDFATATEPPGVSLTVTALSALPILASADPGLPLVETPDVVEEAPPAPVPDPAEAVWEAWTTAAKAVGIEHRLGATWTEITTCQELSQHYSLDELRAAMRAWLASPYTGGRGIGLFRVQVAEVLAHVATGTTRVFRERRLSTEHDRAETEAAATEARLAEITRQRLAGEL